MLRRSRRAWAQPLPCRLACRRALAAVTEARAGSWPGRVEARAELAAGNLPFVGALSRDFRACREGRLVAARRQTLFATARCVSTYFNAGSHRPAGAERRPRRRYRRRSRRERCTRDSRPRPAGGDRQLPGTSPRRRLQRGDKFLLRRAQSPRTRSNVSLWSIAS